MGMVHIYTGDGKGKTTAAVGLCTRAAGHGKKAAFYEFLKGAKTGEAKSLAALGVEFYCPVEREKFTWTMTETEKAECRARQADTLARAAAHMAEYDLVVLDEVLCAVNAGMLSLADVLRTVREKAPNTELVLTGRGAPEELIALADYVSVIEARKHPFADGARTAAREGVDSKKALHKLAQDAVLNQHSPGRQAQDAAVENSQPMLRKRLQEPELFGGEGYAVPRAQRAQ